MLPYFLLMSLWKDAVRSGLMIALQLWCSLHYPTWFCFATGNMELTDVRTRRIKYIVILTSRTFLTCDTYFWFTTIYQWGGIEVAWFVVCWWWWWGGGKFLSKKWAPITQTHSHMPSFKALSSFSFHIVSFYFEFLSLFPIFSHFLLVLKLNYR